MMLNMVQADRHFLHANISQSSRSIREGPRMPAKLEAGTESKIRFRARLYSSSLWITYRIIESVSWVTVSKVVTVFEFASKAR
jgi:hypothetical protein